MSKMTDTIKQAKLDMVKTAIETCKKDERWNELPRTFRCYLVCLELRLTHTVVLAILRDNDSQDLLD